MYAIKEITENQVISWDSIIFVASGGHSRFFDEDVHPLTSSMYLSIGLLLLHLRIPMSSSSLMFLFSHLNFQRHLS